MKTLIELYDASPLENVLSSEVFRPEQTVFLCPPEVGERERDAIRGYLNARKVPTRVRFRTVSLLDAGSVAEELRRVAREEEDCAVDVSGGTDAALFAAGGVCMAENIPAFTYSRRRNTFFEIVNAPFARGLPCPVRLTVADCFRMAGGSLLTGRADNDSLDRYIDLIDPFFEAYRSMSGARWTRFVTYVQRVSQEGRDDLTAEGPLRVKGGPTGPVDADPEALERMRDAGLIRDLAVTDAGVRFTFLDANARFWLRDVGSVLELYVWKACRDAGVFDDVRLSAIVNWEGGKVGRESVTNEIDVACTRAVMPLFISCKTCEIRTEALNELDVLRGRFGAPSSRAAIVTSAHSGRNRGVMRRRAQELDIAVIEADGLEHAALVERLRELSEMRDGIG